MKRFLLIVVLAATGQLQLAFIQDKTQTLTTDERTLIELTNAERQKNGLAALQPNPILCEVARAHAANMARREVLEHSLDGKTPVDRIKEAGYKPALGGENIARHTGSLTEMMTGWIKSADHRKNMLDPDFTEIGVGMAKGSNGEVYYTQVLAKPR